LDSVYGRKWTYAAEFYNEAITEPDEKIFDYFATLVALDVLRLDLWGDNSFAGFFRTALEDCLENHTSLPQSEKDELNRRLVRNEMVLAEAEAILVNCADILGKAVAARPVRRRKMPAKAAKKRRSRR
jgi:hypothetical protein